MSAAAHRRLRRTALHLRRSDAADAEVWTRAVPPPIEPEIGISGRYRHPIPPTPLSSDLDLPGTTGLDITPAEAAQFREFGFLVKRGLIPAADLEPVVDLLWSQPPIVQGGIDRADASTWVAPGARWPESDGSFSGRNRWGTQRNWMLRDQVRNFD